jgi:hypothetical protein
MSIFGNIMGKIFHHQSTAPTPQPGSVPVSSADATATAAPAAASPAPATAANQGVDVAAVLSEMASLKGGGGNYQTSIVDLLKLLDLDASLTARRELGTELGVHAGADCSAEQNVALHRAVMAKLADNGGVVPDVLRG